MIFDDTIHTNTNISEIKNLIGSGSSNLGQLCQHPQIAKWAKYKPVALQKNAKDDTINQNGFGWAGNPQTGTNCLGNPWWIGGIVPVYTIPTLQKLTDIGSNGEKNKSGMWTYNIPSGGLNAPFRMSDFIGYTHTATAAPLSTAMSPSMKVNSTFIVGAYGYEDVGTFDVSDFAKIIYRDKLYPAITIRNLTRGTSATAVSSAPFTIDDGKIWRLNTSSGAAINSGGMGQVIAQNDEVEVFLFASPDLDANWNGIGTKYSLLLDEESRTYQKYKVGVEVTSVDVKYTVNNLNIRTSGISKKWVRYDDNIYTSTRTIDTLAGIFRTTPVGNSQAGSFRITLNSKSKIGNTDYTADCVPSLNIYSSVAQNFSTAFTLDLGSNGLPGFICYNSLADAQAERNPQRVSGYPIFDSIVYNNADAS